jgi:hypothetical protein
MRGADMGGSGGGGEQEVAKRGLTFQIGQAYVRSDAFDIISFHNLDMQNSKASEKD